MKDGAPVGATRAVWFDGKDNDAPERSQPLCAFGNAKAGTASRNEVSKRMNIITEKGEGNETGNLRTYLRSPNALSHSIYTRCVYGMLIHH
jgi:hypothetical protein